VESVPSTETLVPPEGAAVYLSQDPVRNLGTRGVFSRWNRFLDNAPLGSGGTHGLLSALISALGDQMSFVRSTQFVSKQSCRNSKTGAGANSGGKGRITASNRQISATG
jgi:hypothetical protein